MLAVAAFAELAGCALVGYGFDRNGRSGDAGEGTGDGDANGGGTANGDGSVSGDPSRRDARVPDGADAGPEAHDGGLSDAFDAGDAGGGVDAGDAGGGVDAGDAGGGADAGDADAGIADPCPGLPGALFCDGFEDPALSDRWSYSVLTNGTATRDTTRKRTGLASLRAATIAIDEVKEARVATQVLANQRSGDAWIRAYYFMPSTTDVTTHFSTVVMSEIEAPYKGFSLAVFPAEVRAASGATFVAGTMSLPRDRWVCVELHVQIDPSAGVVEAYLDGTLVVSWTGIDTMPADGFTSAEVGIHYAEASQGPVELYVDDVVIGTARTPCD